MDLSHSNEASASRTERSRARVRRRSSRAGVWLAGGTVLLAGCNGGLLGLGIAASDDDDSDSAPVLSDLRAPRAGVPPARISFVVFDQDGDETDVELRFRSPGAEFAPITLAAGSPPLAGIRSDAGAPYEVWWDFAADLGDSSYHDGLELELAVRGGAAPPPLAGVAMGDDVPEVLLVEALPAGAGEYGGNVDIGFEVRDRAGDPVRLRIELNDDADGGFPDDRWRPARPAATALADPTPAFAVTGFVPDAAGASGTFRWDTEFDLAGFDDDVLLRVSAQDGFGAGPPVVSAAFRIDNNAVPFTVLGEGALVATADERGGITIPFTLFDDESDDVQVVVQWREVGSSFPPLPSDPAQIAAILADPEARRAHRIVTELPHSVSGRVDPVGGAMVRLPELAGEAATVLRARVEIAGDELAILRRTRRPEPLGLPAGLLDSPVAALPSADGLGALVLDRDGSGGWRLRDIELATGAVRADVAAAAGALPSGMVPERGGTSVLVAEDLGGAWQLRRATLADGATLVVAGGPGGPVQGLASLGSRSALVTLGDALVRVDFDGDGSSTNAVVRAGLAEPRGLVLDPVRVGRVYVAERAAPGVGSPGRVLALDLDTGLTSVVPAVAAGPANGLPRPGELHFDASGTKLLVVTDADPLDGTRELRGVDVGSADPGRAFELASTLPDGSIGVAGGPERLLVVALALENDLAVSGGIEQVRTIVAYDSTTRIVTVDRPFEPPLGTDRDWRWTKAAAGGPFRTSPEGAKGFLVWDSTELPRGGQVDLRLTAFDRDPGTPLESAVSKRIRNPLDVDPITLGGLVGPYALATGDLNADGLLDVVAADRASSALAVYHQIQPGRYPETPDEWLGSVASTRSPNAVVVADLTSDGKPDIACTNSFSGFPSAYSVTVFRQEAAGFPLDPTYTLGTGSLVVPTSLVVADVHGDGRGDLIVGMLGTGDQGKIAVFGQRADGSFSDPPDLLVAPGTFKPGAVAAADLDGDGRLDLVAGDRNLVALFLQDDSAGFGPLPSRSLGSSPMQSATSSSVVARDLDGDGRTDLVAAWSVGGRDTVDVYLQETDDGFPQEPSLSLSDPRLIFALQDLEVGDVDRDGDLDLLVANYGFDVVLVLLQSEPGRFTLEDRQVLGSPAVTAKPSDIDCADLDGDGLLDLVTCNSQGGDLTAYFQAPHWGRFASVPDQILSRAEAERVRCGDLDGDGQLDIVASDLTSIVVYPQAGAGQFPANPIVLDTPSSTFNPALADLDGDGALDLVSCSPTEDRLDVFFQEPGAGLPAEPSLSIGPGALEPRFVAVGDLDLDGRMDLVTASANSLAVFRQQGWRTFPNAPSLVLGRVGVTDFPVFVAVTDLDGNGRSDVVSVNAGGSKLTAFFQAEDGSFPSVPTTIGGSGTTPSCQHFVAADLNGDARLDVAVATLDGVAVFFQRTPRVFPATPDLLLVDPPRSAFTRQLAAVDLNGDGLVDLAGATGTSPSGITMFLQTSPGRFRAGPDFLPDSVGGGSPVSVLAADVSGDGQPDLVSAGRSRIHVYLSR